MAEHLVTSMVGDPKILTNICPFLEDVDNGLPLVAPPDERWLVDFIVIFSSGADWAPVRMKLPVPTAESKQKLNKFCKAAAGNYGMDVVRFAQALAERPMEEVVQMFNSNRAIFESNDEIDFQALVSNEKIHSVATVIPMNHEKIADGVFQLLLEEVAFMDWHAMMLEPGKGPMQQELLNKHYLRKHGPGAYYGQG